MNIARRSLLKVAAIAAIATTIDLSDLDAQAASQADIQHGPRNKANVALTFHGAGAPDYSTQLFKIFAATKTPVTIFAVGTWLKSDARIGRKIIDAGHDLGNHTMTHTQMKTISAKRVKTEIEQCAAELTKQIGNHGAFFRPSGTQFSTPTIRAAARAAGYGQCISYDVDSHDFQDPSVKTVLNDVMSTVQNGSIISMHLGHRVTLEAMPKLLDSLHSRGLTPVTVTKLLA